MPDFDSLIEAADRSFEQARRLVSVDDNDPMSRALDAMDDLIAALKTIPRQVRAI